ncbi:switch subunit 3 [Actinidia rufa]|uniref:Switch subunit 3 n=1 Tax=Actinidia rufa TaxID=165716 RepID=A0A7J0EK64_9ERIC|nr:switch subunit 3 [Actinidia rufa]
MKSCSPEKSYVRVAPRGGEVNMEAADCSSFTIVHLCLLPVLQMTGRLLWTDGCWNGFLASINFPSRLTRLLPPPPVPGCLTSYTSPLIPGGFRGTTFTNVRFGSSRSSSMQSRLRRTLGITNITGILSSGSSEKNPTTKITFTEARKTIIGDVGSVRRVFDFLETWGLINYSPGPASKLPLKWEEKETKSNTALSQSTEPTGNSVEPTVPKKRLCSGCKTVCSIACFACDKYDLTLCARCYVRGNYRVGVNSTEFRRVEINEEIKADWTEKEILHLLEAIMHYGDDWKRVAEVVGGRSEMECVTRFIKLPFGEQFVGASDSTDVDKKFYQMEDQNNTEFGLQSFGKSFANKRMRLSPLADASNPIAAQAAFLSALVGVEVAEAAASAAVKALAEFSYGAIKESPGSLSSHTRQQEHDATANGDTSLKTLEGSLLDVKSQLDKEEQDLERAIFSIAEVQMKEIQDKISHFEEFESQVEREWQQLQQMKNTLFVDQLTLLFNKTPAPKAGESVQQLVKIE